MKTPENGQKKYAVSGRKPSWLKKPISSGATWRATSGLIESAGLTTVCKEAHCPNLGECFTRGTATFMILGATCTRACRFCAVNKGTPDVPDIEEPEKIAGAAREMQLSYAVVTSVTRDDLPDGGASHFAKTVVALREVNPGIRVELLVPDFLGDMDALDTVIAARPDVLNHNIETVPRLYSPVRPGAEYKRSLGLFTHAAKHGGIPLKSGIMLGLGEREGEIATVLDDLLDAGVKLLTLGQYLQPGRDQLPVSEYVTPETFAMWRERALDAGFSAVASGPHVRSSYRAEGMADSISMKSGL